jgi:hypothetical protein
MNMNVVEFARQILDMQCQIDYLQEENESLRHYRKEYMDQLNQGIKHGEEMMGGLLSLALTPGVMEACAKANEGKTFIGLADAVLQPNPSTVEGAPR